MSRSKNSGNKSKGEIDILKAENKELRSINKSLHRELKKLNKELKTEFVQEDLIKEEHDNKTPKKEICEHCARGHIVRMDLGKMTLLLCDVCEHRKTIKNNATQT